MTILRPFNGGSVGSVPGGDSNAKLTIYKTLGDTIVGHVYYQPLGTPIEVMIPASGKLKPDGNIILGSIVVDEDNKLFFMPDDRRLPQISLNIVYKDELVVTKGAGELSVVELGEGNQATGKYSHAEGYNTTASSYAGHAEGTETLASEGNATHAEGYRTKATAWTAHAEGSNTEASNEHSHSEGNYTKASGVSSHAEGYYSESRGFYSHAEGTHTKAIGQASHAEGGYTEATGGDSHAEGTDTKATGNQSHAEGGYTEASSHCAHSEGYGTKASGSYAHAEGYGTEASEQDAHAEGHQTKATAAESHAEGYRTLASGLDAHAEGAETTAGGKWSHAEGGDTIASGIGSHAEGSYCEAEGQNSHAEGVHTKAVGIGSHAEGLSTEAVGDYQHVFGKFNAVGAEFAEIVGGGCDDVQQNIRELDWNGNEKISGKHYGYGNPVSLEDQIDSKANASNVYTKSETDDKLSDKVDDITFNEFKDELGKVIPSAATEDNKLADKAYVDFGIEQMAAKYLSYTADGLPFPSKAAFNRGVFYYGGQVVQPSKNDYVLINSDETHDNAVTRYVFTTQWNFQYVVNNSPLNAQQLAALNSGATAEKIADIANKANSADVYTKGETYTKEEVESKLADKANTADVPVLDPSYTAGDYTKAATCASIAQAIAQATLDPSQFVVDKTYNANSTNAQSGKAVKEALIYGLAYTALNTSNDLDDVRPNRIGVSLYGWQYSSRPSNVPFANAGTLLVYSFNNQNVIQEARNVSDASGFFVREIHYSTQGTSWSKWKKVYYEATSTYSATGTQAVNGTAVASALVGAGISPILLTSADNLNTIERFKKGVKVYSWLSSNRPSNPPNTYSNFVLLNIVFSDYWVQQLAFEGTDKNNVYSRKLYWDSTQSKNVWGEWVNINLNFNCPTPPTSGTAVLKSVNGTLTWVTEE